MRITCAIANPGTSSVKFSHLTWDYHCRGGARLSHSGEKTRPSSWCPKFGVLLSLHTCSLHFSDLLSEPRSEPSLCLTQLTESQLTLTSLSSLLTLGLTQLLLSWWSGKPVLGHVILWSTGGRAHSPGC